MRKIFLHAGSPFLHAGSSFLRAGFIKEAHYRQAWPDAGGDPLAAVAYAILRSNWEFGSTTTLDWNEFTL